jgi:methionine-rich copper-binding protein CopC
MAHRRTMDEQGMQVVTDDIRRIGRFYLRAMIAALALAAIVLLPFGSDAQAHAMLRRAVPLVGGAIATAPTEISLEFSESLEPRFSSIEVQDAKGNSVDKGNTHSGANDPKRLIVDLPVLSPGTYKVLWRATSVDTHRTEGSYVFSIQP